MVYVYIATRYTAFSSAVVLLIVVAYCYDTLHPTLHTTHAPAHASHVHHWTSYRSLFDFDFDQVRVTNRLRWSKNSVCASAIMSIQSTSFICGRRREKNKTVSWLLWSEGWWPIRAQTHQFAFDLQDAVVVLFVLCVLFVLVGSGQIGSKTQPFPLVGSGRRGCDSFHVGNCWMMVLSCKNIFLGGA